MTDKDVPVEEGQEKSFSYQETKGVRFLTENAFMRSSSCLTTEDLAEGRLPEARDEVVIYSRDPSILGKEETCFFTADNLWNKGEVFQTQVKVVGLLKETTDQVYFDHRLCQMITVILDRIGYSLDFFYVREFGRYLGNIKFYPMVAQDLKGNQIRVSKYVTIPNTSYGAIPTDLGMAFGGTCLLHIHKINDAGGYSGIDTKKGRDEGTAVRAPGKRQDGIEVTALGDQFSDQGPDIIEVSEELFGKLYDKKTTQASVYITSYSKTDSVLDTLLAMGYDAINTYRTSTINYIQEKVLQRLEVIGISVIVLIVMVILQILLIRSILKIKRKDYQVLQFMGMRIRQMKGITYLEMGIYCLVSILAVPLLMVGLSAWRIPFFVTLMQYYTPAGLICFVLYNVLLMTLAVGSFHRLLRRNV